MRTMVVRTGGVLGFLLAACAVVHGGQISAITDVRGQGTVPTEATVSGVVTGCGDVFVEYAHSPKESVRDVRDRYARTGLIAMWDGVDNQGTGVHSASATNWVDVTGRHAPMKFEATPAVNANSYDLSAGGGWITDAADIAHAIKTGDATIEVVCEVSELVADGTVFALVDGNACRIAWARSGDGSYGCLGVVGSVDYRSWTAYEPFPNLDTATNVRTTYSFDYATDASRIHKNGAAAVAASVVCRNEVVDEFSAYFSLGRRISLLGKSAALSKIKIYSVRVYNRRLTDAEREANHAADVERFAAVRQPIDLDQPGAAVVETAYVGHKDVFSCAAEVYAAKESLIAMWDGEDNQGTGAHVTGATTWVDLTGGHAPMTFEADPTVNERDYDLSGGGGYITSCADLAQAVLDGAATVEITCSVTEIVEGGTLFALVDGTGTSGTGVRLAWARSGTQKGYADGVVASSEYRSETAYTPHPCIDAPLNTSVTFTFDYASDRCRIYKDGAVEASGSVLCMNSSATPSTAYFSLGRRISQKGRSDPVSKIKIQSVRFYNRRLTAEERAANAAMDARRFGGRPQLSLGDSIFVTENGIESISGDVVSFSLRGLRADTTAYTARLFATNAPEMKSSSVVFDSAPESLAYPWYECVDSRDGNAVINLGFAANGGKPVVRTKFQLLGGRNTWVFGCTDAGVANTGCYLGWQSEADAVSYRLDDARGTLTSAQMALGGVHEIKLNGPEGLVLDGTVVDASFTGHSAAGELPWYLFGLYIQPANAYPYVYSCKVRLWDFALWADGSPVRDLVGVRRPDGGVGMFDRVTRTYLGRGFNPGPLMDSMPRLADARKMGNCLEARLTRTGTEESDVYLACGATYGGVDLSAWDRVEKLATGFDAEGDSLSVRIADIGSNVKYARFLSLKDGWSETLSLADVPIRRGMLIIVR